MHQLYVHIGTHKTGSTAIQSALKDSAPRLLEENICWVPFLPIHDVKYISSFDTAMVADCRQFVRDEIAKAGAHDDAKLVMSDEDLSGHPLTGYDNASITADLLRAVTDGYDTRIVLYVRRQDSFIESLYTQRMYRSEDSSFAEFMQRIGEASYDWCRLADTFAARFGTDRIIVRLYDRKQLPEAHSLVHGFADVIGSRLLKQAGDQFGVNAGLSKEAAEIAQKCNPHLSQKQRRKLRFILQTTQPKRPLEEYSYLDAGARADLLSRYAGSNEQLARKYLGIAGKDLFSPPDTPDTQAVRAMIAQADADPRALYRKLAWRALPLVVAKKLKAVF